MVLCCDKYYSRPCANAFGSLLKHHLSFYRAMQHYSAKRGPAIACRLFVCLSVCPSVGLSVCDVGGSRPYRLKILETNCTNNWPNIFALRSPKVISLLPEKHGEILGRLEVGWEKVACWSTKAAISMKRVKIERKSYHGGPIGFHQRCFNFLGRRHISTSVFAIETAVFSLFLPVQHSDQY